MNPLVDAASTKAWFGGTALLTSGHLYPFPGSLSFSPWRTPTCSPTLTETQQLFPSLEGVGNETHNLSILLFKWRTCHKATETVPMGQMINILVSTPSFTL